MKPHELAMFFPVVAAKPWMKAWRHLADPEDRQRARAWMSRRGWPEAKVNGLARLWEGSVHPMLDMVAQELDQDPAGSGLDAMAVFIHGKKDDTDVEEGGPR